MVHVVPDLTTLHRKLSWLDPISLKEIPRTPHRQEHPFHTLPQYVIRCSARPIRLALRSSQQS